jgi:phospholipid/cholesterol/gamma-HCH transport system substrate-binding protein
VEFRGQQLTALGLLVVVSAVLFIWGMFYMMGNPVLSGGMQVVMAMDHGAGLKRGDRVQLNGVTVGSVRSVELEPSRRVLVELRLDDNVTLAADTRGIVRGDLFGAHTVDLLPGDALVRLHKGDTIRGSAAVELADLVADLGGRATSVLSGAESLLSPQVTSDVEATAAVLPASAAELQKSMEEMRLFMTSLRRFAETVEQADAPAAMTRVLAELENSARTLGESMDRTMTTVDRTMATMDQSLTTMDRSLEALATVLEKIERGDGTLGMLVNDESLYRDLHDAVKEVRMLTEDIRERPGRYINVRIF